MTDKLTPPAPIEVCILDIHHEADFSVHAVGCPSIAADEAAREAKAISPVTTFADEVIAALEASLAAEVRRGTRGSTSPEEFDAAIDAMPLDEFLAVGKAQPPAPAPPALGPMTEIDALLAETI